jgi:hypothetical protein
VTPGPAAGLPVTGGQYRAQVPEQFDLVEVSGANQYKVKPLELVSTCLPPIVLAASLVPDEDELPPAAAEDELPPAAAGVPPALDELLAELPQAATVRAMAARPAAPHIFRITKSPCYPCK